MGIDLAAPGVGAAADESARAYPGWRVVAACFVLATFSWGFSFYGHGFYLVELRAAHGWPTSVIAGATTFFYLFSAVLSAFIGDVLARFGARATILAGIALMTVAAAIIPAIAEPWQLYAAYAVMSFGWAATSLTAITTVIGSWFQAKRGLAISIALTGASFGGILVVPLLALASSRVGFAMAVWCVAGGLGTVVALFVIGTVSALPPRRAAASVGRGDARATILRSPSFWAVSGPFALAFFAQVGFLVHQIAVLEPTTGRATAGLAVAITTAAAVGGRLALGAVVDRLDLRFVTAVSFASQAAALAAIAATGQPIVLLVACAVFGFSVGNVITLPALIIGKEFALRDFAVVVGLSNAVCQIAYAFGPGLLGVLRDRTGSYAADLALCVVLDVLAAAAILLRPARAVDGAGGLR